jgi:hypothetical protein
MDIGNGCGMTTESVSAFITGWIGAAGSKEFPLHLHSKRGKIEQDDQVNP